MYAHQSALGTETKHTIEWLQPQALKRCLSETYTTLLYVVFALKQNRTIPVMPFISKLTVKPGSIRSGFGTECRIEYLVTDLLSFKTRFQTLQDGSSLHPVLFLPHLLKRQHLARLFL